MADHNTDKHRQAFITAATEKHIGFYDYSDVEYVNAGTKVAIRCPKHGTFKQAPADHKKGQRCPQCSGRRGATSAARADRFIEQSKEKFGTQFDYSKLVFVDQRTNVTLVCKDHGEFTIRPTNHLTSLAGCHKCADKVRASSVSATAQAVREQTGALPKRFAAAAGGNGSVIRVELLSSRGVRYVRPRPGFDVVVGGGHELRDLSAVILWHFFTGVNPEQEFQFEGVIHLAAGERFDYVAGTLIELFGGHRFRCTVLASGVKTEVLTGETLTAYPDSPEVIEYRAGVTDEYGQRF
jgi:hypothetical protein